MGTWTQLTAGRHIPYATTYSRDEFMIYLVQMKCTLITVAYQFNLVIL